MSNRKQAKKSILYTQAIRHIKDSKLRFVAILLMIMLGTLAFTGLQGVSPLMRNQMDQLILDHHMYDIRFHNNFGLSLEDQELLKRTEGLAELEFAHQMDALTKEGSLLLRLHSRNKAISSYRILEGRMPDKDGEIAVDANMRGGEQLRIGDEIELIKGDGTEIADDLTQSRYKVTGLIQSVEYMYHDFKGHSTIGTGEINGFGVIAHSAFLSDSPSTAYLRFHDTDGLRYTDPEYLKRVRVHQDALDFAFASRPEIRLDQVRREAQDQIADNEQKLDDAQQKLSDAEQELQDSRKKLDDGLRAYYDGKQTFEDQKKNASAQLAQGQKDLEAGRKKLDDSAKEYAEGQKQYLDGLKQYNEGYGAFAQGKSQITIAKMQLDSGLQQIASTRANLQSNQSLLMSGISQIQQGMLMVEAQIALLDLQVQTLEHILPLYQNGTIAAAPPPTESNPFGFPTTYPGWQQSALREKIMQSLPSNLRNFLEQDWSFLVPTTAAEVTTQLQKARSDYEQALAQKRQLEAQLADLQDKQAQLQAGLTQLDASEQELMAGMTEWQKNNAVLLEKEAELAAAKSTLDTSGAQLTAAQQQISMGELSYQSGLALLNSSRMTAQTELTNGEQQLRDSYNQLLDGESKYQEGLRQFEESRPEAESELRSGESRLADAKNAVLKLESQPYQIDSLQDDYSVSTTYQQADSLNALAILFPALLYLVALLVSLTMMTRMVEEERLQIGTLKALGYGNNDISMKYLTYATIASVIGTILGLIVGYRFMQIIIYDAYMVGSMLEHPSPEVYPLDVFIATALSLLCTGVATLVTIRNSLRSSAAELMRPKAPKSGNRILLERVPFLWKRLTFLQKVSMRNLFRYKVRSIVTIIGLAGCTALLFMGFGLKDSIVYLPQRQFETIQKFDSILVYDDKAEQGQKDALNAQLADDPDVLAAMDLRMDDLTARYGNNKKSPVSLIIPQDPAKLPEYMTLQSRTDKKPLSLPDDSILITEKLTIILGLKVGDTITLENSSKQKYSFRIGGITENYLGHYIFLKPELYQNVFGKEVSYNAKMLDLSNLTDSQDKELAQKLLNTKPVLTVIRNTIAKDSIEEFGKVMDPIVLVITILSASLCFTVLFSLTDVNISERIRELSTIKVLGFYPKEVTSYIYRETLILSLFGILLGYAGGFALHRYIVTALSPDNVMMLFDVFPKTLILSGGISIVFTLIIMFLVHRQLKHIDMLEALKSVE